MGRGDSATGAPPVGGDRVSVPTGATATGHFLLQTRPHPGGCLSGVIEEYPAAVPPADRAGVGDAVSRDRRDPAGTAGLSLYGGRAQRAGHKLLAAGGPTRPRTLRQSGSH